MQDSCLQQKFTEGTQSRCSECIFQPFLLLAFIVMYCCLVLLLLVRSALELHRHLRMACMAKRIKRTRQHSICLVLVLPIFVCDSERTNRASERIKKESQRRNVNTPCVLVLLMCTRRLISSNSYIYFLLYLGYYNQMDPHI